MKRRITCIHALAAILVLAVVGAAVYVHSGLQPVGADVEHGRVAQWLLQTVRERSVGRQARGVELGLAQEMDERLLQTAVIYFEEMCTACHAPPGRTPGALARGLNPPAPDLARAARQRSPAELFWVTRHGIRMTGMPAWGRTHSDEELWLLVALLLRFPDMEGDEYGRLLAGAREAGVVHDHDHSPKHGVPHDHGEAHEEGDPGEPAEKPPHDLHQH
jgi:mono/diheme cytochrome c family protein